MELVLSVVIVILAVILIFFVLIQNSKGGGLASNFSSGNQILGVRKTTDTLEKITWTLVGIIVVLCIASTAVDESNATESNSAVSDKVELPANGGQAVPSDNAQPAVPTAPAPTKK